MGRRWPLSGGGKGSLISTPFRCPAVTSAVSRRATGWTTGPIIPPTALSFTTTRSAAAKWRSGACGRTAVRPSSSRTMRTRIGSRIHRRMDAGSSISRSCHSKGKINGHDSAIRVARPERARSAPRAPLQGAPHAQPGLSARVPLPMTLIRFRSQEQDVDLARTYDAVVVGSGAAGGMAAHVLTSQGMKVLLLEAGKKIPIEQELRSMEWPYDHPRRGEAPPGDHAIRFNEYTVRKPPYAKGSAFKHVFSYVGGWGGSDYVKNILVDEKNNPYTGTKYAWVRARLLGGKTNIWGRLALRLSDYDFKGRSHDGYGEDWPISYADIEPFYDKVDLLLGISGLN